MAAMLRITAVQRPARALHFLILFGVSAVLLYGVDLRGTAFGQFLQPAIGVPMDSGIWGRVAIAIVVAVLITVHFFGLRFLPFRVRVGIVWVELLILCSGFFYSFNLSYAFIASRIGFLITQGAFTTIYISLISILISSVIAMAAALARLSNNSAAYAVSTFYISFFRGIPLLLQICLIYLGLPQLGFVVSAVLAGIAALSLCYGAYMAEIFRAGILAVPQGQHEAAAALGLPPSFTMHKFTMYKIVLPQAMKLIVSPTGNQFIAMLKDSSLVSVVGVWELMFLARTMGRAEFKHLEMLITAALIYWVMTIVFELIQGRIELYYGKSEQYKSK